MSETQPLAGRAGWYGRELDQSGAWIRTLTEAHRAEIDAALAGVKRARLPLFGFGRDDFPLPGDRAAARRDQRRTGERPGRRPPARPAGGALLRMTMSGRSSGVSAAISAPPCTRTPAARSWARCATRRSCADKTFEPTESRQDRLVQGTRSFNGTAALAHRPLRCHRSAVRAQRQGRRDQQAHQHRDDLQRDPASPARSAGAAVPGLLERAAGGRGRRVRHAGVRRAGRQADMPVFAYLCGTGAGAARSPSHHRGAERGAGSAGRGGGGSRASTRRSCPATSSC